MLSTALNAPTKLNFFERIYEDKFCFIGVDSPYSTRFQRLKKRNREGDPKNWLEFLVQDFLDKRGDLIKKGQATAVCMRLADYIIYNDGTIRALNEKVYSMLIKYRTVFVN